MDENEAVQNMNARQTGKEAEQKETCNVIHQSKVELQHTSMHAWIENEK